jgi:N,N'-diacetyllegionaminate synthase
MLRRVALEADEQRELKAYCDEIGILYLCTPYEEASLTQLISMDVPALKIASTDTTNVPFLRSVARAGIPVILSTGMCTLGEVERAVREFRLAGTDDRVVLMHCVSQYPAPAAEAGLGCIDTLQRAFGLPTGYSDHVQGNDIALCSVAAGACAVEKHFTLDRSMEGPDHRASSTPPELADLVSRIRTLEAAIGDGYKQPMPSELANKPRMQKSLVARESISAGDVITARNLTTKRPATGMLPYMFDEVVGRTAAVTIPEDTTLTYEMVDWNNA